MRVGRRSEREKGEGRRVKGEGKEVAREEKRKRTDTCRRAVER